MNHICLDKKYSIKVIDREMLSNISYKSTIELNDQEIAEYERFICTDKSYFYKNLIVIKRNPNEQLGLIAGFETYKYIIHAKKLNHLQKKIPVLFYDQDNSNALPDWQDLTTQKKEEMLLEHMASNGVFKKIIEMEAISKEQLSRCIQLKHLGLNNETFADTYRSIDAYWNSIMNVFGEEKFFNTKKYSIITVTSLWVFFRLFRHIVEASKIEAKGDRFEKKSYSKVIKEIFVRLSKDKQDFRSFWQKKGGELKRYSNSSARYELYREINLLMEEI